MSEEIFVDKWFNKKITISLGKGLNISIIVIMCLVAVNYFSKQKSMYAVDSDSTGLEISDLVRKVKYELYQADSLRIANNEGALFNLKSFEMEISFTVRQVIKDGITANYKFVTVEGGSETGNEKVQKLILQWEAVKPEQFTVPVDTLEGEWTDIQLNKSNNHENK